MNYVMEAKVIEEAGYDAALQGLGLNKKQTKDMTPVAKKLCDKDGGHNKFLEAIYVWIEVKAPRYWWQEADTYRISSKQSEASVPYILNEIETMPVTNFFSMFEEGSLTREIYLLLKHVNKIEDKQARLVSTKQLLPEGFCQKRMWCMNYKTLRNIIIQRRTHSLPHWRKFISDVLQQVKHPELLPGLEK